MLTGENAPETVAKEADVDTKDAEVTAYDAETGASEAENDLKVAEIGPNELDNGEYDAETVANDDEAFEKSACKAKVDEAIRTIEAFAVPETIKILFAAAPDACIN